jgi:hypothetical protein
MSEWKQGAAARRDQRATKTDAVPPYRSRKDRKRWCKGKVGVEHVTKVMPAFPQYPDGFLGLGKWKIDVCEKCGRHVRFYSEGDKTYL